MKDLEMRNFDRRGFLKLAGMTAAAMGLAACAPAAAPTPTATKPPAASTPAAKAPAATAAPSDAEAMAGLYEAAKKEGQVMAYAVGTAEEWQEFTAAFEKKYPGIKLNGFTGSSEAIRDKVLTEARAGRPVADVIARTNFEDVETYIQQGVLEKYVSPELKNFDQKYYDPQGLWAIHSYYVDVLEYNTQAIPAAQAPRSYQDLLKPDFKGKLGLEASAILWFTSMLRIMGKDKGLDYMRKLAEQKPRLVSGHTTLHKLVVSGEIPVLVYMYHFRPLVDKGKGAPIEWLAPAEATPTGALFTGVIKNAPRPNAARLVQSFWLSEDAGKILVKHTLLPARRGVELGELAPVAKVNALIINDPAIGKETAENEKTFRDIFGKG